MVEKYNYHVLTNIYLAHENGFLDYIIVDSFFSKKGYVLISSINGIISYYDIDFHDYHIFIKEYPISLFSKRPINIQEFYYNDSKIDKSNYFYVYELTDEYVTYSLLSGFKIFYKEGNEKMFNRIVSAYNMQIINNSN